VCSAVPEDTRICKVDSGMEGFVRKTFNDSVGERLRKIKNLPSSLSCSSTPRFTGCGVNGLSAPNLETKAQSNRNTPTIETTSSPCNCNGRQIECPSSPRLADRICPTITE
jgi:hypothetical protein